MAATGNEEKKRYEQARRDFDDLSIEDQATFLVEATAATLARGIQEAGKALADGIEDLFRQARHPTGARTPHSRSPGAAEPETAQRRAPRGRPSGRSTAPSDD